MPSLLLADPPRGELAPASEIGAALLRIMCIRRQHMGASLVQHTLSPVPGPGTEETGKRSSRDLHPYARGSQLLYQLVAHFDPFQALGMSQNRHVAGDLELEKHFLHPLRHHVVRRLYEDVARAGERQHPVAAEPSHAVRSDVIIRSRHERQRDPLTIERILQARHRGANTLAGVVIHTGQDMGCARDHRDTIGHERTRHLERCRQIGRAVVHPGEHVAMQVDHGHPCLSENSTTLAMAD